MTNASALEIARRLDTNGPANTSPLGQGLHEAKLKEHADFIAKFCAAVKIDPAVALAGMEMNQSSQGTIQHHESLEDADA